jgi:NDP-sugar pyrophosphorylase family protein
MQGRRLRALVLAAGLGTRLRPLTELVPKPLLPVTGVPILGHTLAQLAAAGCEAVAVNLHHLGGQIRQRFGDAIAGMPITWSEEPELLGTLGAFWPLRDFFAPADLVLLINGDSLCQWPLRRLIRKHLASEAKATLLLASRPAPSLFGGGVGIDREGRIVSFWPGDPERGDITRRYVFAGAHVFAPDLLAGIGPQKSDIVRNLYVPLLDEGGPSPLQSPLQSMVTARSWHDLGTPQRFLEAVVDQARAGWPERLWRRAWVSPEAAVGSGAKVRHSAVEAGAQVEDASSARCSSPERAWARGAWCGSRSSASEPRCPPAPGWSAGS